MLYRSPGALLLLTFCRPQLEVVEMRQVHGGVLVALRVRVGRSDERQKLGHGIRSAAQQPLHVLPVPVVRGRYCEAAAADVPESVRPEVVVLPDVRHVFRRPTVVVPVVVRSDQRDNDHQATRDPVRAAAALR